MGDEELERLSIEHIRIYESFEKKEKCALCRSIEEFENQILNSISTDLVMDLDFFPKFGDEYTFCDYHMSKMEDMRDKLGMAIMLKKLIALEIRKMENSQVENKTSKLFMKKSNDKKKIDELKQIEVLKDKKIVFFTNGELKSLLERRYVNTMIL